jgi:transcription factor CON7
MGKSEPPKVSIGMRVALVYQLERIEWLIRIDYTEFKEIRKEWKARKKEEEQRRKQAEEVDRQRAAQAQNGGPEIAESTSSSYAPGRPVQLPPIAYQQSGQYPPSQGAVPQQALPTDYSPNSHMYPAPGGYQPQSPYGYNQRELASSVRDTNSWGC